MRTCVYTCTLYIMLLLRVLRRTLCSVTNSFLHCGLTPIVCGRLASLGITTPTAVQRKVRAYDVVTLTQW